MKYQLIIQFPGSSLPSYDDLIEIEDELTALLNEGCEVDGHDMGAAEAHIFIFCEDPVAVLRDLQEFWPRFSAHVGLRIGYRARGAEGYIVLFPRDLGSLNVA
jgi:hypothetical protein